MGKWYILRVILKIKNSPDHIRISRQLDSWALHPITGPLLLATICLSLLQMLFFCVGPLVDILQHTLQGCQHSLHQLLGNSLLVSLLADGILTGVGSLLCLTPLIVVLFIFLGALQQCGYQARISHLLGRLFARVGLAPQTCTPMMASFACAVPAMLALRNVPSKQQRLIALLIIPFFPCSARLPVYSLLIAACFAHLPSTVYGGIHSETMILFGLYSLGILAALATAFVLKWWLAPTPLPAPLMHDPRLPAYRIPSPTTLMRTALQQVWGFWKDAGTIIVAMSVVLWGLFVFPQHSTTPATTHALELSYAGQLGKALHPLFAPLGFDWRICVSLLASFAAREAFIPTLAIAHGLQNENLTHTAYLYSPATALALLVFFALSMQCMSTLATCKRETNSWMWPLLQWVYMGVLAWLFAWATYQIGAWAGFA
ncbi:MAG: ferrous iron transporter B [Myxococcota bacterium]